MPRTIRQAEVAPKRPPAARRPSSVDSASNPEGLDAASRRGLSDSLRSWFAGARRALPWRDAPTPWRVWVSEVMLQQTQVDTVIPYFHAFIARFPDPATLAAASLDDVLARWSGLGYYRRARLLHAGAIAVAERHGGELPRDPSVLRTLPGVGPYTAGAIASIAFGVRAPLVDGNVERVLSRLVALEDPSDGTAGKRRLWTLAEALVSPEDPSAHNQGLMELGALVCTPARPACEACPWAPACRGRASGRPTDWPLKLPRRAPTSVQGVALAIRPHAGSDLVLLARRPADGLLAGLWGLPETRWDGAGEPELSELLASLGERLGVPLAGGSSLGHVVHAFTHRSLTLEVRTASNTRAWSTQIEAGMIDDGLAWAPVSGDGVLALSTLARKSLALLAASRVDAASDFAHLTGRQRKPRTSQLPNRQETAEQRPRKRSTAAYAQAAQLALPTLDVARTEDP